MSLKFFTEEELEKLYGKEFSRISPTDSPLDKFKVGHNTILCNKCGNELDVKCSGNPDNHNPMNGFVDIAYCNECDIEYKRKREIVNYADNKIDYENPAHRTDEREDYLCRDCHQRHVFTKNKGPFETSNVEIFSYENVSIRCKCGEVIDIANIAFPDKKECTGCDRTYEFNIT